MIDKAQELRIAMHNHKCDVLDEIERKKNNGWIGVDDKLPEADDTILMYDASINRTRIDTGRNLINYYTTMTHWQPLPACPTT